MGLLVGLCLATMASFSASLSHLLFRRSSHAEQHLPWFLRWRWFLACFTLLAVHSTFATASLTLLPLTVTAPFSGVTMSCSVWLGHCGACGVSERLTLVDLAWTLCVLAGVVTVSVVEATVERQPLSQEGLLQVAGQPVFIAFWLVHTFAGYAWLLLQRLVPSEAPLSSVFISAVLGAVASALTKSFAKLAGASVSLAFMNVASVDFPPWFFAASVAGLVTSAPLDLLLLSRTIMSANLVIAVPLYESLIVVASATAGSFVFSDTAEYSTAQWASLLFGLGLVLSGVVALGITNTERRQLHGDAGSSMKSDHEHDDAHAQKYQQLL